MSQNQATTTFVHEMGRMSRFAFVPTNATGAHVRSAGLGAKFLRLSSRLRRAVER